jgi:hypothetical protein
MTEIAIFGFGGVIFIITTWATVAFGLRRVHELQREDLEDSPRIEEVVEETNFTEIYVTREVDGETSEETAPSKRTTSEFTPLTV